MHSRDGLQPGLLIALLLALTFTPMIVAQEGDEEEAQQQAARERLALEIPVPADRDAIAGQFTMAGEVHKVSAGEIYDMLTMMTRLEGAVNNRPNDESAWEQIMLATLADSMGIEVPESAIDQRLRRSSPEVYAGVRERWLATGVSPDMAEKFLINRLRTERVKDLFFNNARSTTQDAFDQFKINRLLYKVDYVTFSGAKHAEALRAAGTTDAELENYWQSNQGIQARFRLPARISGTVVYLDPRQYSPVEAANLSGSGAISRERALAYFRANRDRLIASVPPSERQHLTISDGTAIEEIKSPFEIVRPMIEKKLALEHLIDDAFKEALGAGLDSDLEAIAKKHHLKTLTFEDLDRRAAMDQMQIFGVAAFTQLFSAPERQLSGGISIFEDVRFFYRVDEKKPSEIPEFAEVKDELAKLYCELAGAEQAQAEVKEILDEIAAKVAEKVAPERARLEAEAEADAERQIAERGLTDPGEQARQRARSRSQVRLDIDRAERDLRPTIFAEVLERHGLELESSPIFEFDLNRFDRSDLSDPLESRMAFFRNCYQLRAMKPGEVLPAALEDHLLHEFHLARLAEIRDPALESMGPVDRIQAMSQIKQLSESQFPRQFEFNGLAQRFGLERF